MKPDAEVCFYVVNLTGTQLIEFYGHRGSQDFIAESVAFLPNPEVIVSIELAGSNYFTNAMHN